MQFFVDQNRYERVTAFLSVNSAHGWEEEPAHDGGVVIRIHLEDGQAARAVMDALRQAFPGLEVETDEVVNEDWALAWKEFFTPIATGERFMVLPPWLSDTDPEGRTPIIIEPKQAFGTGHHDTTALCLEAVGELAGKGLVKTGGRFLDLGTGSGILGLGCAMLGLTGVGLDIDPLAVVNAEENKVINGIGKEFLVATGGLETLAPGLGFDLIVANILARPLQALAPGIIARLNPGARLVLSGILTNQADEVVKSYTALGLPEPERLERGEWSALIFDNPA